MDWSTGAIAGSYKPKEWWVSYGPITYACAPDVLGVRDIQVSAFAVSLALIDLTNSEYSAAKDTLGVGSISVSDFSVVEALIDLDSDGSPVGDHLGVQPVLLGGFVSEAALIDITDHPYTDALATGAITVSVGVIEFALINLNESTNFEPRQESLAARSIQLDNFEIQGV